LLVVNQKAQREFDGGRERGREVGGRGMNLQKGGKTKKVQRVSGREGVGGEGSNTKGHHREDF